MFGINGYEFIILVVLALVLLGPERLPEYAQTLARWVRQARGMAEDAKTRFRDETGTDFDAIDWQKYDPRQYDPRRIIREALAEDYEDARQAIGSVRQAASLESGSRVDAGRSGAGRTNGRRADGRRADDGEEPAAPEANPARRAGAAGALVRSENAEDPRTIFSSSPTPAGGALAAGMAGAAAAGHGGRDGIESGVSGSAADAEVGAAAGFTGAADSEDDQPAPFDVDAT